MKHAYVDLGLPSGTLWATKNFTMGKQKHFTYYEAMFLEKIYKYLEVPSKEDFKELIKYCTWKWTRLFGKTTGCKVTGPNGNSIFLPASGFYRSTILNSSGADGYYWSTDFTDNHNANYLHFTSNFECMYYDSRYYMHSIRTVKHITKRK